MPRSFNQKLKILYLMKAFEEKTDREHPISVAEIIKYMDSYGISVERKAVYDDIETLRVFGMKIENRRGRPSGYFLADRKFELPELKILMDAVQSSRFLTQKQSRELLRKLESLTSVSEARKLQYQTYTVPGVKSPNNEVYQNIQGIYDAIAENHQIGFLYYEWDFSKNLKQKRGGERYRVSPWKLIWKNENYYLLGMDEKSEIVKHYRVDKIKHLNIEKAKRNGESIFQNFDMEKFSAGTFGMFGGKEQTVKLSVHNKLAGVIIDRFGKDVMMIPADEEHFNVNVDVRVSRQFLGWVFSLGSDIQIVGPDDVVEQMRKEIARSVEQYRT